MVWGVEASDTVPSRQEDSKTRGPMSRETFSISHFTVLLCSSNPPQETEVVPRLVFQFLMTAPLQCQKCWLYGAREVPNVS